jgi:hypothetical protein
LAGATDTRFLNFMGIFNPKYADKAVIRLQAGGHFTLAEPAQTSAWQAF